MKSDDTQPTEHVDRSTEDQQDPEGSGPTAIPEQYAALSLIAGGSIIYDQRDSRSWIQSDVSQDLEQMA